MATKSHLPLRDNSSFRSSKFDIAYTKIVMSKNYCWNYYYYHYYNIQCFG